MNSGLVVGAFLIFASVRLVAQSTSMFNLSARVIDRSNEEPIPFAKVEVEGTAYSTITDTSGSFLLSIPESRMTEHRYMVIEYLGFETFRYRLRPSDMRDHRSFRLRPRQMQSDPLIYRSR